MDESTAAHRELAAGRWHGLSLLEQLANIGSEVDRAMQAHASGRASRRDMAMGRALELFDLTAADERWRGPRRREVLRAREEFCRLVFEEGASTEAAGLTRSYFYRFAIAARRVTRRPEPEPARYHPGGGDS